MKSKVLVSSILTIALCLSLIAGSTFALFTDKTEQNIAVTSGKVDIDAKIANVELWSVEADDVNPEVYDEYNKGYSYKLVGEFPYAGGEAEFTNGGTAKLDGALLTLDRVTPGDKIVFDVKGANNSNVAISYRVKLVCHDGYKLMSGLNVYINSDTPYAGLRSYTSEWMTKEANEQFDDNKFVIELPVWAGNEYQNISTSMAITIEAVQGNANVNGDVEEIVFFDKIDGNVVGLKGEIDASRAGETVFLKQSQNSAGSVALGGVNLDGNGKTLNFMNVADDKTNYGIITAGGDIKNVTITGDAYDFNGSTYGFRALIINDALDSDIRIDNSNLFGTYALNTTAPTGAYALYANDSTFNGWTSYANLSKAVFTDCDFKACEGQANVRPYVDSAFVDCEFDADYTITVNKNSAAFTITLDSCYAGGIKVTAENFKDLLAGEDNVYALYNNTNVTVIVDGVAVVWN